MASLSDLISDVAAAAVALPGGTKARLSSDHDTSVPVPVGTTGIQVRATLLTLVQADSGAPKETAAVELVFVRRLATAESEQTYVAGDMAADQRALIARAFWTALPSVYDFIDGGDPGVNQQPERVGPLLIYTVLAQVALAP